MGCCDCRLQGEKKAIVRLEKLLISRNGINEMANFSCSDLLTSKEICRKVSSRKANETLDQKRTERGLNRIRGSPVV